MRDAKSQIQLSGLTHFSCFSADFIDETGTKIKTKIIDAPGNYKLCGDITFGRIGSDPADSSGDTSLDSGSDETSSDFGNGGSPLDFDEDLFDPDFDNSDFDPNAFGLGFFAAIAIAAPDVKLFLNGFTIEQAPEHALMQRFFSIIELADSPFIKDVGPAQFVGGDALVAASNVEIVGPGVLGRSSHHGR